MIAAALLLVCQFPPFKEQLVDDTLDDLWACAVADVNGDGKPDLVALNWGPAYVVWYENPSWKRRILIKDEPKELVSITPIQIEGRTELVLGFRGVPEGKKEECVVYLFHPLDAAGEKWEKKVLDDKGLGSEDIICADFNGDGKIDIAGVGRSTKNVKLYWNQRK